MTTFNIANFDATQQTCFFGESVNIARYDKQRYSIFEKLTEKQLGFFWRPEEVDLSRDAKDFKGLTEHEKHIFTSNLKRQILLDSVQGRAPSLAFLPICSLPELETWIQTWAFFETIHSRSYTHHKLQTATKKQHTRMQSVHILSSTSTAFYSQGYNGPHQL